MQSHISIQRFIDSSITATDRNYRKLCGLYIAALIPCQGKIDGPQFLIYLNLDDLGSGFRSFSTGSTLASPWLA
jgi:hypothetical protein